MSTQRHEFFKSGVNKARLRVFQGKHLFPGDRPSHTESFVIPLKNIPLELFI